MRASKGLLSAINSFANQPHLFFQACENARRDCNRQAETRGHADCASKKVADP
jgi:hypothetical protein